MWIIVLIEILWGKKKGVANNVFTFRLLILCYLNFFLQVPLSPRNGENYDNWMLHQIFFSHTHTNSVLLILVRTTNQGKARYSEQRWPSQSLSSDLVLGVNGEKNGQRSACNGNWLNSCTNATGRNSKWPKTTI